MIDIHAHILPGADDGAKNIEETKILLRKAYSQGIRGVIATPHYFCGKKGRSREELLKSVEEVQALASGIGSDFYIYPGNEIYYTVSAVERLLEGSALTLAGSRYVLVEFSLEESFKDIYEGIRRLTQARYYPIIAHVERYPCLKISGAADELIRAGAYLQMNYSALSDTRNLLEQGRCRKLVWDRKIHFLGTDMHRPSYRMPEIEKALAWLRKRVGCEYLEQITDRNAGLVISGKRL